MASARHVLRQGRVAAALADTAVRSLLRRWKLAAPPAGDLVLPGPELSTRVAPLGRRLVRDYIRHVGGDPRAYDSAGVVPAHLFPQWAFPTLARTLRSLPFPLLEVVNGGCRLEMEAPLSAGVPLEVRAWLESVEDDGRRTLLRQRVVTGPLSMPDAVSAEIFAVVPSRWPAGTGNGSSAGDGGNGVPRPRKERPRVPLAAREAARWRLAADAGWDFALLTGDFNPVHWSRRYARLHGFDRVILHGFALMARAIEGLNRAVFAGATDRLRTVDVRFTRPLNLPAQVGLYLDDRNVIVGDAPGGPAYLVGTFDVAEPRRGKQSAADADAIATAPAFTTNRPGVVATTTAESRP